MYIYTYNPTSEKHLKITVPDDWTSDDVDFFLKGKPHLSRSTDSAAKRVRKIDPIPDVVEEDDVDDIDDVDDVDDDIEDDDIEDSEDSKDIEVEAIENTETTVKVESPISASPAVSGCPEHPNYTGKRLGKNVKDCNCCRKFYESLHR